MSSEKRNGIAVLGCGTVGGGTAKILVEDAEYLKQRTNLPIFLKYIVDVKFDHAKAIGLPESLYETNYTPQNINLMVLDEMNISETVSTYLDRNGVVLWKDTGN